MENKKNNVRIFKFNESYQMPKYKYNAKKGIIEWGDKNNYPSFILDLYNAYGSTTHKSIINKKAKLISGQGFEDVASEELKKFIKKNKLEKEVKKATLDYELLNGFAFEVIWNNEGTEIATIEHVPFHKIRIGIESDELNFEHFWYSNDWSNLRKKENEPELIRSFNALNRQGRQLYYYTEYNPQTDGLYPIPGYSTTINWVELDYEISKFHLNQVKQGYSPSFILNFATGIPSEEEQDEFHKAFKKNYSGAENSGKIILTWSEGEDGKPELTPIQLNDSDDRFVMLMEQIETQVVRGHEIPPQLIILTPGKLSSTDERVELQEEFQSDYVSPRQTQIEEVLNEILNTSFDENIKLKNKEK
jgi:hypothetical protein